MAGSSKLRVVISVDVEPDCPPFLWTWRGIEEGMPRLLEMLQQEDIRATFFTTGATAERYPHCVDSIAQAGHEIGNHGFSHTSFRALSRNEAEDEISRTSRILRRHSDVKSFRAPYLQFPAPYLDILTKDGITVDASRAVYKYAPTPEPVAGGPVRLSASVTSSVLRLPRIIRNPWLAALRDPVVLFVHPWEFVDLRESGIRLDCRFGTGIGAIEDLRSTIRFFKKRDAQFVLAGDFSGDFSG